MNKIFIPFKLTLIAFWTVFSAITTILLVLFTMRKNMSSFVGREIWSPGILFICGIKLVIKGKENIIPGKNYIFISNHESHLDIPAIFSAIPVDLFFIAKKELKKVPFMGWAMQVGGMIFIDRKNKEKAQKDMLLAGELIKNGKNVISFPEGTRTRTGDLGLFRRGSFLLSLKNGIEIVPITLIGTRQLLPSGTLNLKSGKIYISINKAVSPEHYTQEEGDKFASDVREIVLHKKSEYQT